MINQKTKKAQKELKKGRFVLVHDAQSRENETDLVCAAQFTTPEMIKAMRKNGGGLICAALGKEIVQALGLPFLAEIEQYAQEKYSILQLTEKIPYDEKSSFSIPVNHQKTFTGIPDKDRASTIRKLAEVGKKPTPKKFISEFRSPGHVPLLLSSGLENREGHTELVVALLKMSDLTPVGVVCEMLGDNHNSLSPQKAQKYAQDNNLLFLEKQEIKEAWQSFRKKKIKL